MPVRFPTNRYGKNIVGKIPSLKLGRMVMYESRIERDWIYLMEYDPTIVLFEEQPLTIKYTRSEKQYQYTPDFKLVKTDGQHVLVECKVSRFLDTERNQAKMAAARQWCAMQNWEYQVVTELDLKSAQHRLNNVKLLFRFARNTVPVDLRARIYAALNMGQSLSIGELITQLSPTEPVAARAAILAMLWHQELYSDLDGANLTNKTYVQLPKPKGVMQ